MEEEEREGRRIMDAKRDTNIGETVAKMQMARKCAYYLESLC